MAVSKLIFQVRVPVEYHQGTFSLQVSHELRHTVLWWYTYKHVYVVGHLLPLNYFHTLVITQLPQYMPDAFLVLSIYCLAAVFRRKYYMVFTQPFCMAQANPLYLPFTFLLVDLQ